jgi:predicted double-glycine peptidase
MKLNISELRENMIAYTINDGTGHYTVINGITNDTVKLADPGLGNIEMNIEEFAEIYSGYALVINDPNDPQVNETTDQSNKNTNSSDSINNLTDTASDVKADNRTLTDEEMKNIKGKNGGINIGIHGSGGVLIIGVVGTLCVSVPIMDSI